MSLFAKLAIICFLLFPVFSRSSVILHQVSGKTVVRMDASNKWLVYQIVGQKQDRFNLHALNLETGVSKPLAPPRRLLFKKLRPFDPSVAGDWVAFGAGDVYSEVDVFLQNLETGKRAALSRRIPWIVEPSLHLSPWGQPMTVWDEALNFDGQGLNLQIHYGLDEEPVTLQSGPAVRNDIPRNAEKFISNEYPAMYRDDDQWNVVFQNNEYGTPNVYLKTLEPEVTVKRLSPSIRFQQRPEIHGEWIVWEESEQGFARSNKSDIFAYHIPSGEIRKLNEQEGFHYQAKVYNNVAFYGAKRAPWASTPSIRAYDLTSGRELKTQYCFPGAIYDWSANEHGLLAAQNASREGSRILFATWKEIRSNCL